MVERGDCRGSDRSIGEIDDLCFQHLSLGRWLLGAGGADGLEDPVGQRSELEEVEQPPRLFDVGLDLQRCEVDFDRRIAK